MKLIIHRGTHEIGGTCVEPAKEKGARIMVGPGMTHAAQAVIKHVAF